MFEGFVKALKEAAVQVSQVQVSLPTITAEDVKQAAVQTDPARQVLATPASPPAVGSAVQGQKMGSRKEAFRDLKEKYAASQRELAELKRELEAARAELARAQARPGQAQGKFSDEEYEAYKKTGSVPLRFGGRA